MPTIKRYTVYDAMEARGDFARNPANAASMTPNGQQLYTGPVAFPKVVYAAEEDVIVQGAWEDTKQGPKFLNEQKALKNQIVQNEGELKDALASGWFDHPAKALKALIEKNRAAGLEDNRKVPLVSAQETLSEYEKKIADLEAQLARAQELAKIASEPGKVTYQLAPSKLK